MRAEFATPGPSGKVEGTNGRRTCAWPLALVLLGLGVGTARPQAVEDTLARITLSGESPRVARRLADVQKLLDKQQWSEAIEEYQHILDEAGDELVPAGPRQSVPARRLCHLRLAALPPKARQLYRDRVDDQARKWLEQGIAQRDARLLRRVVEETFCSRFTDRALDLLGDLAFEQGRFEDAEHWWRMLALPARAAKNSSTSPIDLLFPDPRVDLALVRAKQLLARLFRGQRNGLTEELKAFRELHAQAKGTLAGRQGVLADILQQLLDQPTDVPTPAGEQTWPTFAGAPARSFVPAAGPRLLGTDGHQWQVQLDAPALPGEAASALAQMLAYHPVIADDQVLVANARSVTAFDLLTGRRTGHCDLIDDLKLHGPDPNGKMPSRREVRYTLTVADGCVYARLGAQAMTEPTEAEVRDGKCDSYLVCLDLRPSGGKLRPRWQKPVRSRAEETDPPSLFEGAPLVRDGRVYIARTRFGGGTATTAIDCYDVETATPRWRQDVCAGPDRKDGELRQRQHLLTLAGPQVVYCSHSGAIVALDAVTGRRAWAARYPTRGPWLADASPSPRDLAPCVAHDGRLFVAPADLDRILCLDAGSGQLLWESQPIEVVHLLGVAHGRLICTTGSRPRGIRALDAATGKDLRDWIQPDDGNELSTFGRGLLAGAHVYWPTVHGLRILGQEDGQPLPIDPTRLRHIKPGNLAFGNGCLVVATMDTLLAYVPAGRQLEERKQAATRQPQLALPRYLLARSEADAGLSEAALADFARAETLAGPDGRWQDVSLRELARLRRQELLGEQANQARSARRWTEAAALLERAAAEEFAVPVRLQALARQADLWLEAGQPSRAVAILQRILADPVLRVGRIVGPDGNPQPAAAWAVACLERWSAAHGPRVYQPYEMAAARLYAAATAAGGRDDLERVAREYLPSQSAALALRQLALDGEQRAGRPGAAAEAYRQLLRLGEKQVSAAQRAEALLGLARIYEKQRCWTAARTAWQQLASRHGEQSAADPTEPGLQLRDLAARRLKAPEYRGSGDPALPLPLQRSWQVALTAAPSLLVPEGGDNTDDLFCIEDNRLTCRDARTGKLHWRQPLSHQPAWLGRHADLVVAAGPQAISVVQLADGQPLWHLSAVDGLGTLAGPATEPQDWSFSVFHLASGRLFCLQGQRRLWALDVESGQVLWSHWAPAALLQPLEPGGRFYPLFQVANDWVIVQSSGGKRWFLDSRTGRKLHQAATSPEPWPCPPTVIDEHRLCLVPDTQQVLMLDPATGKEVWRHVIDRRVSLTGEAPQLLAGREAVLLLVARNLGYELLCLDPATGSPRWPQPVLLSRQRLDLARGVMGDAIYLVHDGVLHAYATADGRRLWQQALPNASRPGKPSHEDHWQLRHAGSCLIAYPQCAAQRHGFPVLLCDPKDGQLIQCLNFPATDHPPAVARLERRLAVALGNTVWGLTTAPVSLPGDRDKGLK